MAAGSEPGVGVCMKSTPEPGKVRSQQGQREDMCTAPESLIPQPPPSTAVRVSKNEGREGVLDFFFFEIGSHGIAQAGHKLEILPA